MTIHTFLNMVVDWVSGDSEYKTRLELGQSSGTLTDLRFMVPAWIEKVQTIWFGENGSESAYTGSDGAKITAYLSAGNVTDLVFFDPQNTGGKTLSDLASVAGLWETSGTRTSLISSQPIDLANELNMAGQIIDNVPRINANGTGGIVIYDSTDAMRAGLGSTSYALQCFNAGIDMGDHDINNINDIKGNQAVGADVDFYGSNAAGGALVNFMGWDSATETVKVNKPMAMGANKITGLAAATVNGDALRYEQAIGVYLPLSGGTMSGSIAMDAHDITGVDDITMNGTGSLLDMNYGSITDCNNLTMYDANVDSPVLALSTTNTESGTGMWMYVAAGKTLKIYENFGDTLLAQLDYDGDLSLAGGLSVASNITMSSHKITGLAAATVNGDAVRYEQLSGTWLPLAGGTMSGDIDMATGKIDNLNRVDSAGTGGIYIKDSTGATTARLGATASSFIASKRIDMNAQEIINLGTGGITGSGDITLTSGAANTHNLKCGASVPLMINANMVSVDTVYGIEMGDNRIYNLDHSIYTQRTSDPASTEGLLYYNTSSNTFKYYNGSAWKTLAVV